MCRGPRPAIGIVTPTGPTPLSVSVRSVATSRARAQSPVTKERSDDCLDGRVSPILAGAAATVDNSVDGVRIRG